MIYIYIYIKLNYSQFLKRQTLLYIRNNKVSMPSKRDNSFLLLNNSSELVFLVNIFHENCG